MIEQVCHLFSFFFSTKVLPELVKKVLRELSSL